VGVKIYSNQPIYLAGLHKYLHDELNLLCMLQFFTDVAQNSLSFPNSEKSLSIFFPDFPVLWSPDLRKIKKRLNEQTVE